jgi:hypothetical protein
VKGYMCKKEAAMHIVKSIGVLSMAKIMGAVYGALGLIFMPIFLLVGFAGMMTGSREGALGAVGGVVVAVLFPVIYAAMGFVGGAIGALLYNLFARWVGGIELQLQSPPAAVPAMTAAPALV